MKFSIKRALAVTAVAASASAAVLLAPTVAAADDGHVIAWANNPYYVLSSAADGSGTLTIARPGELPGQVWALVPRPRGGLFLVDEETDTCARQPGLAPSDEPVVLAGCNENDNLQQWDPIEAAGNAVLFMGRGGDCLAFKTSGYVGTSDCRALQARWYVPEA